MDERFHPKIKEKGLVIMILSVSRRTDIPNYYSQWFYNRIKAGFVYVKIR